MFGPFGDPPGGIFSGGERPPGACGDVQENVPALTREHKVFFGSGGSKKGAENQPKTPPKPSAAPSLFQGRLGGRLVAFWVDFPLQSATSGLG